MAFELALCALLIEALVGYPGRAFRAIGHPVVWMGGLVAMLDRRLNHPSMSETARRGAGGAAILIVAGVTALIAYAVERGLLLLPFGFVLLAIVASTLLAQRSLYAHVARVAAALDKEDIAAARAALAHIVGRDPETLDAAGIARAAIESLAENFSDGVVAPAFWLALAGLPGGAAYKAINTADSMVGHRTPRHEVFGAASARLDDLVNLPASRLSALLVVAAAALTRDASARCAWRALWRDAHHHRSPNAGYPEAAFAGALDLALAGPRVYGGVLVEDAIMGDGRRAATAAHIRAALSLYIRADALLIVLFALVLLVCWFFSN
jgi:adenosylcobinamide-phosphate synthase